MSHHQKVVTIDNAIVLEEILKVRLAVEEILRMKESEERRRYEEVKQNYLEKLDKATEERMRPAWKFWKIW